MKNTFKYFAAALTVIAAVSCAKQEFVPEEGKTPAGVGTYDYTIQVTQEDTKTTMDGLSILWKATDQIGVGFSTADPETPYLSPSTSKVGAWSITDEGFTSGNKATFGTSNAIPEGATPYVAGYPFYSAMSLRDTNGGEAINVTIPSTQTAVKGGIPDKALVMVGKIVNGECFMRNAASVIKFTITREDIVSLIFTGNKNEKISNRCYYFIETGEREKWTSSAENFVKLIPPDESTVFEPGDYYFVVGQETLTEGFTMTLTNTAGQQAVRRSNASFEIKRNQKYTQFGSDEGWFTDIKTLTAGQLGSETGTTAVIYGKTPSPNIAYGFEISIDGTTWESVESEITNRFTEEKNYIYSANLTDLTPGATKYFRAVCTDANGITTYGKTETFKTYANAQSVIIDLYNGYDSEYWPFTNIFSNEVADKTQNAGFNIGTSSVGTWIGVDCPMTVTGDYTFTLKASSAGIWLNTSATSLTFRTSKSDYLKFPVIKGKKPVSVTLMNGGLMTSDKNKLENNTVGAPSITDAEGNVPTGGKVWEPKNQTVAYYSKTWDLIGTSDNSQYQILFNSTGRNCYLSYLEVVYETIVVDESKIEQTLLFSDGSSTYWPFDSEAPRWNQAYDQLTWNGTNICGQENVTIGSLKTTLYPNIEYNFFLTNISQQNNWRITPGRGLRFGPNGDYMQICPVEGHKLFSITIGEGNAAASYSVCDMNGQDVEGGAEQPINEYEEYTFNLSGTSPNTEYRLVAKSNTAIYKISITYERVE